MTQLGVMHRPELQEPSSSHPLHAALARKDAPSQILGLLFVEPSSPGEEDETGCLPLHWACARGVCRHHFPGDLLRLCNILTHGMNRVRRLKILLCKLCSKRIPLPRSIVRATGGYLCISRANSVHRRQSSACLLRQLHRRSAPAVLW